MKSSSSPSSNSLRNQGLGDEDDDDGSTLSMG